MKLADAAPPRCSGCFQAKPHDTHVDFEVAWDGPTFPGQEVAGMSMVAIDDLVLCDHCIATAAALLGLEDATALRDELRRAQGEREKLQSDLEESRAYAKRLEDAVAEKPKRKPRERAAA